MRASNLFIKTEKEAPANAELVSHQLMLRAGLIKQLSSGIYTWMPLGLKTLTKVSNIIREEFDKANCQEILMPNIQTKELWQESGRWDVYGPMLLRIKDRAEREFCYGPTHEEVITDITRDCLNSYKQLPICFYQIQNKFRDEIRPRFGVMRAREFTMADAYSFHMDESCLRNTYKKMYDTYHNIFTRLGLKFRAVEADCGDIGGENSHEFQVLADSGEDKIAYSDSSDYAANIEKASALLPEENNSKDNKTSTKEISDCPIECNTVKTQAKHFNVAEKSIIKTILVKSNNTDHKAIALVVCGDDNLNETKVCNIPEVKTPLELVSENELKDIANVSTGFAGPIDLGIPVYVDHQLKTLKDAYLGYNQDGKLYAKINFYPDFAEYTLADIREVKEGDKSPDGKGLLKFCKGIEVGHIFELNDKYTKALNATVLNENGKTKSPLMGCYGIGVSRIVAATIEQHHDDRGIIWPVAIAPYTVVIAALNYNKSEQVKEYSDNLYQSLKSQGIEVLLDDRNLRPGFMFKDLELLGIPYRVVVSDKSLEQDEFEVVARKDNSTTKIKNAELISYITNELS